MRRSGGRGEPSKHFPVHFSSAGLNWAPLFFSFLSSTSLFRTRLLDRSSAPPSFCIFYTPNPANLSARLVCRVLPLALLAPPPHLFCCFTQLRDGPLVTYQHRSTWSHLSDRRCLIWRGWRLSVGNWGRRQLVATCGFQITKNQTTNDFEGTFRLGPHPDTLVVGRVNLALCVKKEGCA